MLNSFIWVKPRLINEFIAGMQRGQSQIMNLHEISKVVRAYTVSLTIL